MASLTKSQANTQSTTTNDTLVSEADQRFIDNTDIQILEAIEQGKFSITSNAFEDDLDPKTVFEYYANLGYAVSFPDQMQNIYLEPANLFGQNWINYWTGGNVPSITKRPLRFLICWT